MLICMLQNQCQHSLYISKACRAEMNMIKKGKGIKLKEWLFLCSPNHRKTQKTVPIALSREQRWERHFTCSYPDNTKNPTQELSHTIKVLKNYLQNLDRKD